MKRVFFYILFSLFFVVLRAQDVGEPTMQRVMSKEWNFSLFLNTSGGGIGFQHGRTPNYSNKYYWETDIVYSVHYKSVRGKNANFINPRSFCYGKLHDLFLWRLGYGYQRTTNHKPYWGGVQVRYFFSAGFSLGIGLPTYLEIAYYDTIGIFLTTRIERYNPEKHNLSNIVGGAPWHERFHKLAFRPGFYAKTGVNFDFSKNEYRIRALEVGLSLDMVFPYLQQIAHNKSKPFYFNAYLAFNFGRKKAQYE